MIVIFLGQVVPNLARAHGPRRCIFIYEGCVIELAHYVHYKTHTQNGIFRRIRNRSKVPLFSLLILLAQSSPSTQRDG